MLPRRTFLAAALIALTPVAAQAQIYSWRDAKGHLVLSDRPTDPSAKTYAVASAGSFRATRAASRGRRSAFDDLIAEHATREALNPALVRAVVQAESGFNPRAVSVKGALGLMQLMPETAQEYGVTDPFDPSENIRAGVQYLKRLLARYDDNESLALAAYNAGPGAVDRYGGTVPPYRETREYVARIRAASGGRPTVSHVYRLVRIVDGHEVVSYSNVRTPDAEIVKSADRR